MCGIIGILKTEEKDSAVEELVSSLKRMDYRGYDSWGYAILHDDKIKIEKKTGRITKGALKEKIFLGIGHTRWATHGGVTDENAHPHTDCKNEIAIVHNGIIENYIELKKELEIRGHKFKSETDTEVIAHLFEEEQGSFFERAKSVSKKLKGSFALVAIDRKNPNEMIAIKNESPLLIGKRENEFIVASDPLAFLDHTQNAYLLEEGDIVLLRKNGEIELEFYNFIEGKEVKRNLKILDWKAQSADLNGYAHYMLKEIMEQPFSLRNGINEEAAKKLANIMKGKNVVAVACGSARHATVIGKHILHRVAKFQMEAMMAHEFSYFVDDAPENTLILAVSQSGETADVLDVVRKAKARNIPVISIVNVSSSTLARESKAFFPLNCGPEIAVASTKAFSNQVLAFYLIAYAMINNLEKAKISLSRLIVAIEKQLPYFNKKAREIAEKIYNKQHAYVLGKGVNFAIALEGALKIKEISYIHA
ncbi:MAG: glutamine--fructose-6-phosphate transaminase (isomerizing), partial [Candidatus ainarchaeum sp.]|nr:glutamine--fructose-6-phosphate transaminase (isomerizing) [Candidatus ainarchaeum sp.]